MHCICVLASLFWTLDQWSKVRGERSPPPFLDLCPPRNGLRSRSWLLHESVPGLTERLRDNTTHDDLEDLSDDAFEHWFVIPNPSCYLLSLNLSIVASGTLWDATAVHKCFCITNFMISLFFCCSRFIYSPYAGDRNCQSNVEICFDSKYSICHT